MKRKSLLAIAVALASQTALSAGFYLKEQSIVSQGAAFAGAGARTDSASSVYFNPAGTAGMDSVLELGAHVLIPDQTVTGSGDATLTGFGLSAGAQEPLETKIIPNFYYTRPLAGGVVGVGVSAPYGSTNEYDRGFLGAMDSYYTSLKTIDLSVSYARALSDNFSLGGALVYQTADIEQRKLILPSTSAPAATLKGESSAFTFTVGAQLELENGGVVGLSYKPAVEQDIEGTNNIGAGAGPLSGTWAASGKLKLPSTVSLSAIVPFSEQTDLLFDVTRYGWSAYDNLTVNTPGLPAPFRQSVSQQNYKDTTSFALGLEHSYDESLTVRAGVHFDPTPTNDTDRSFSTPDGDRTWLALGASKKLDNGWIWDFAYTHIDVDTAAIDRTVSWNAGASNAQAQATAESSFNILSIGVRIPF